MLIINNKEGIPYATYGTGHNMGNIQHIKKGSFVIERRIELPLIINKGIITIDLFIHHPMVEYYIKAPRCCTIVCEGYQEGYGKPLNQEDSGFVGLKDA